MLTRGLWGLIARSTSPACDARKKEGCSEQLDCRREMLAGGGISIEISPNLQSLNLERLDARVAGGLDFQKAVGERGERP